MSVWPPLPFACKLRVRGPVMLKLLGLIGTLAVTPVILHTGAGSHGSESFTVMTTGSSFLFGGVRTFGNATTEAIVGATSWTVTFVLQEL